MGWSRLQEGHISIFGASGSGPVHRSHGKYHHICGHDPKDDGKYGGESLDEWNCWTLTRWVSLDSDSHVEVHSALSNSHLLRLCDLMNLRITHR